MTYEHGQGAYSMKRDTKREKRRKTKRGYKKTSSHYSSVTAYYFKRELTKNSRGLPK